MSPPLWSPTRSTEKTQSIEAEIEKYEASNDKDGSASRFIVQLRGNSEMKRMDGQGLGVLCHGRWKFDQVGGGQHIWANQRGLCPLIIRLPF